MAAYSGGVSGFPATNPKARGAKTIDLKGTDTTRYRSFLKSKQDAFTGQLAKKIKGSKVNAKYDLILNAVAVTVPDDSITAVAKLPGVAAVYPDTVEKVQTDTSPAFLGAPTVWGNLGGQESSGEGVIVGVLDTGIWPEHPSFSDPDPSGKPYAPPPAAPDGSRACQFGSSTPGDVPFTCNNKIIGAYRFMATYDAFGPDLLPGENRSARDDDGHGTHTSSTAAGNAGVQASDLRHPARHHLGHRPARLRRDVQGLRRRRLLQLRLGRGSPAGHRGWRRMSSTSPISGGVQPVLRRRRTRVPRCLQRGRLRRCLGRQRRSRRRHHRSPRAVGHGGRCQHHAARLRRHRPRHRRRRRVDGPGRRLADAPASARRPLVVNSNTLCDAAATAGTFTDKIVICKRGNPIGRVADGCNVLLRAAPSA